MDVPDGISYLSYDLSKRFREVRHIIGSPFLDDKQDRTYILRCLGEIRYEMEKPIKLIIDSLNGSVATVLYDFFNKFADEGGEKKIKLKLGGKIPTTVTIHNEFSCVYLVLNSELSKLDNPFLSRFEKYYFSCSGLARETCGTVTDRLESFIRDV